MSTRTDFVCRRLADRRDETIAFFEALPATDYHLQIYTGGDGWTTHHILAHFVSAERAVVHFFHDWLAHGPGLPDDFDIDAFNQREVAALAPAHDRAALLAAFRTARDELIALAAGLSDAQLDRNGRHPWFGDIPAEKILKFVFRHNQMHERDIRAALRLGGPVPEGQTASPPSPTAGATA